MAHWAQLGAISVGNSGRPLIAKLCVLPIEDVGRKVEDFNWNNAGLNQFPCQPGHSRSYDASNEDADWRSQRPLPFDLQIIKSEPGQPTSGVIHPRGRPADRGYKLNKAFVTAFRHYLGVEPPARTRVRKQRQ